LTVDECMSAYEGLESFECHFTLPHTTKIARKPKGVGCELKFMADVESGIILKLELMEGKDKSRMKEFENEFKLHTAITLRLAKDYFGTSRTIIVDSAFSSVDTCQELLKNGLHFLGMVKTASSRFPKAYFKTWASDNTLVRGSHKVMTTKVSTSSSTEAEIFAVAWKDLKLKTLICSRGTTTPGSECKKLRHRIIEDSGKTDTIYYHLSVKRPKVVEMLFNGFSVIDIHDHYRQGSLALEESWQTRTWWHRIFSSIFGIILTDAYFCYRLEYRRVHHGNMMEFPVFDDFLGSLAYSMIFETKKSSKKQRTSTGPLENDETREQV